MCHRHKLEFPPVRFHDSPDNTLTEHGLEWWYRKRGEEIPAGWIAVVFKCVTAHEKWQSKVGTVTEIMVQPHQIEKAKEVINRVWNHSGYSYKILTIDGVAV